MRKITRIVIHCSATPPKMDIGADTIRDWHVNGNGWADIGYHDVIRRNGLVESGRPHDVAGAHAKGYNQSSIGICLIGGLQDKKKLASQYAEFNFTQEQMMSLFVYVAAMKKKYPGVKIVGHNELSTKGCPMFNVAAMFN